MLDAEEREGSSRGLWRQQITVNPLDFPGLDQSRYSLAHILCQ